MFTSRTSVHFDQVQEIGHEFRTTFHWLIRLVWVWHSLYLSIFVKKE